MSLTMMPFTCPSKSTNNMTKPFEIEHSGLRQFSNEYFCLFFGLLLWCLLLIIITILYFYSFYSHEYNNLVIIIINIAFLHLQLVHSSLLVHYWCNERQLQELKSCFPVVPGGVPGVPCWSCALLSAAVSTEVVQVKSANCSTIQSGCTSRYS
jgi:hypothetical protein